MAAGHRRAERILNHRCKRTVRLVGELLGLREQTLF